MKKGSIETAVGIFVIIGLICVGYLTVKLGKMALFGEDVYHVYAKFQSVSGLKSGAYVEMAGVRVGQVDSIALDRETLEGVLARHAFKTRPPHALKIHPTSQGLTPRKTSMAKSQPNKVARPVVKRRWF